MAGPYSDDDWIVGQTEDEGAQRVPLHYQRGDLRVPLGDRLAGIDEIGGEAGGGGDEGSVG